MKWRWGNEIFQYIHLYMPVLLVGIYLGMYGVCTYCTREYVRYMWFTYSNSRWAGTLELPSWYCVLYSIRWNCTERSMYCTVNEGRFLITYRLCTEHSYLCEYLLSMCVVDPRHDIL